MMRLITIAICSIALGQFTVPGRTGAVSTSTPPPTCGGAPPSGAVANWSMNEGSGNTSADSVSADTLSYNATPAWSAIAGVSCSVPSFANNYAQAATASSTSFAINQPFSVAFWLKPTTATGGGFEAILGNFDGTSGFIFGRSAGPLNFQYVSPGGLLSSNASFGLLEPNVMYGIVATYSGATGTAADLHFYVNGVSSGQTIVSDTLSGTTTTSQPLRIGNYVGANIPFTGPIWGVQVYNRVLSSGEASAIYSGGVR